MENFRWWWYKGNPLYFPYMTLIFPLCVPYIFLIFLLYISYIQACLLYLPYKNIMVIQGISCVRPYISLIFQSFPYISLIFCTIFLWCYQSSRNITERLFFETSLKLFALLPSWLYIILQANNISKFTAFRVLFGHKSDCYNIF